MKHSILSLFVGLAFVGCTSEEVPQQGDCNQETAKEVVLTVINNPQQIGANELAEYAGKVLSNSGVKSRAQSASTVTEVYSDKNGSGIYAVNFGENEGFVLLTTQQQMHPVIAMSETGHFDVASLEGSPIELWLKGVEMAISHPEDIPDSVVMAAKLEWNKLNSTEVSYPVQSRSDDDDEANAIIAQATAQWRQQGYSVTCVAYANASDYPESIANAIIQIKNSSPAGSYQAERSFILTKTTQRVTRNFPEVLTTWQQGFPYNSLLPNNENHDRDLGCVAVAVAQIINYHKKPISIDFSQFPNKTYQENIPLSSFLKEVGEACGIDYYASKPYSNIDKAKSAFAKYTYSCRKIDFDHYTVLSSLKNGPLFMRGDVDGDDGHAWVCDGANAGANTTSYSVKSYTGDFGTVNPTAAFATMASTSVDATIPASYHMNWGWSTGNGWYFGTDWTVNLSSGSIRIHKDIQALVDIVPQ